MVITTSISERDVENSYKTIETKWKDIMLLIVQGQLKKEDSLLIADTSELVADIEMTSETLTRMPHLVFVLSIHDEIMSMRL